MVWSGLLGYRLVVPLVTAIATGAFMSRNVCRDFSPVCLHPAVKARGPNRYILCVKSMLETFYWNKPAVYMLFKFVTLTTH
jgi:hypothetical protein